MQAGKHGGKAEKAVVALNVFAPSAAARLCELIGIGGCPHGGGAVCRVHVTPVILFQLGRVNPLAKTLVVFWVKHRPALIAGRAGEYDAAQPRGGWRQAVKGAV